MFFTDTKGIPDSVYLGVLCVPSERCQTMSSNLHHSQFAGNSKGISSSAMGSRTKSFFFIFPFSASLCFSFQIFSRRSEAGSSLGFCGTSLPCIAHCKMLFLSCFPSIRRLPLSRGVSESVPVSCRFSCRVRRVSCGSLPGVLLAAALPPLPWGICTGQSCSPFPQVLRG